MAITNHAALERFEEARAEFAVIECRQNIRIDENGTGLMEGANQVFAAAQIHSGLAADAGIHLRHHSGRDLYNRDAAHKNCGEKTGAIAHNSATKGYQQRLTNNLSNNQTFRQL